MVENIDIGIEGGNGFEFRYIGKLFIYGNCWKRRWRRRVRQGEFIIRLFIEFKRGSVLLCEIFVIRQKIKLIESTEQLLNFFIIYGFQVQLEDLFDKRIV